MKAFFFFFFFFGDRLKNFCEDLFFFFFFFFFWRALALCVLGPWPWPRAFLSLASRVSVLGKAVLGLGLGLFLCPWPWPRALCPRLHLCQILSSSPAATCPPVYHTRRRLYTGFLLLNVKQGSYEYKFYSLWFGSISN